MLIRTSRSTLAVCAAPLLASCMLRLESSPESDEYWGATEEGSDVYGAYAGRVDPGSPRPRRDPPAPPLTIESDYGAAEASIDTPTDVYRELIVLDPGVLGPLSDNADASAPFSFRAQMEWLAGPADALALTNAWLREWETATTVGPELTPVTPRSRVGRLLTDPWLGAVSPAPEASSAPSELARAEYGVPDPAAATDAPAPAESPYAPDPVVAPAWPGAPFTLIAIVNRVDLANDACTGSAGELRYVYGARTPDAASPLDVTLILEVPYPATRSAAEWARAWQELAALPPGSEYTERLAELGREIMTDSDPLRARLRSNEVAFADAESPGWELREFKPQIVDGALALLPAPLEFTPRSDADPAELSAYVLDHSDAIESSGQSLPDELRAGAASLESPDFSWNVLGVSERLRSAFSLQTCNGCHGGDTATLPFRHIAAGSTLDSPARLSRFLYDPDAPSDELRRRLDVVDALGASECTLAEDGDEADDYAGYGG